MRQQASPTPRVPRAPLQPGVCLPHVATVPRHGGVSHRADIILKYDGDEARSLKTYGELPDTVQINAGTEMLEGEEFGDDNFDFDEVDEI